MGRKILVGMLLLGALIVFALATFYIENWERYIQKGYEVRARFTTAQTLQVGDEVRIAGVEVGRVNELHVETDKPAERPVEAVLWIRPEVKLRTKDVAHIETRSVFGGSFITITREDPEAPLLTDGDELTETVVEPSITELISKAGETLDGANATFADARSALEKASSALDGMGETFKSIEGITQSLEPESLQATIDSARKAFDGIDELTTELAEGEGMLPKLLRDKEGYDRLNAAVDSTRKAFEGIEQLTKDVREGEGLLAKLINDPEGYARFESTLESTRGAFEGIQQLTTDLREGEGLMARLISDEEFAAKVQQIATDTGVFAASMAELVQNLDNSSLGKLMTTDEAHQKLMAALDDVQKSAEALSQEKGTLGKLINDDTLHQRLTDALQSLQDLLDDYREQSPILTFAGAIFGAF